MAGTHLKINWEDYEMDDDTRQFIADMLKHALKNYACEKQEEIAVFIKFLPDAEPEIAVCDANVGAYGLKSQVETM